MPQNDKVAELLAQPIADGSAAAELTSSSGVVKPVDLILDPMVCVCGRG